MSKMTFDVTGMSETLRFWSHGNRPLVFEGTAGSDLVYALRMHEDVYHVGRMLEQDLIRQARIQAGVFRGQGGRLKTKNQYVAFAAGVAAELQRLHTPTPEGMPGRKYLTRVAATHEQRYAKEAQGLVAHAIAVMAQREGISLVDAYALIAEKFLAKVLMHITERASDNVPFWHGDLRASLFGEMGGQVVARGNQQKRAGPQFQMEKARSVRKTLKDQVLLQSMLNE